MRNSLILLFKCKHLGVEAGIQISQWNGYQGNQNLSDTSYAIEVSGDDNSVHRQFKMLHGCGSCQVFALLEIQCHGVFVAYPTTSLSFNLI